MLYSSIYNIVKYYYRICSANMYEILVHVKTNEIYVAHILQVLS